VLHAALLLASLAPGSEPVDELLHRMQSRFEDTAAVSCEIEQTRHLSALTRPVELGGTVLYMKPHFLRVDLVGDESLSIYANGRSVWIVDLDLDEVEVVAFGDGAELERLLPGLTVGGVTEIRRRSEVFLEPTDEAEHRLVFVPRPESGLPYDRITLDLDGMLRIRRSEVVFSGGDTVESRYRAWKRLPALSPHAFEYRPGPEGDGETPALTSGGMR
jgi:outer membrane lipoprotein-sorting protein